MVVRGKEAFCVHRKKKLSCLWLKLLKNGSKVKKKTVLCSRSPLSNSQTHVSNVVFRWQLTSQSNTCVSGYKRDFITEKAGIVSFSLNRSVTRTGAAPHDNAAAVLQLPAEICWTDSKTFVKYESSAQQYVNIGNFPFCPSNPPDKNIRSETKIICLTISTMSGIKPFCLDI